jgi:hypothetical protein
MEQKAQYQIIFKGPYEINHSKLVFPTMFEALTVALKLEETGNEVTKVSII